MDQRSALPTCQPQPGEPGIGVGDVVRLRIERAAVPVTHLSVLFVPGIGHGFQESDEPGRTTDVFRRTSTLRFQNARGYRR